MSDSEKTNQRIAKNTIMLYGRMLIMLLVSLYTSRIVLQTLGVTDYGIYNVVGGIVALLGFVSNAMSISVQRFLSYDIGKNDIESLNRTFSTAIVIHILIALLILLVGETIGLYFVSNHMNFPIDRYNAAIWVFHLSLIASFFKILQVPYNALIISYERMDIFAYLSIGEAVLNLAVVYLLRLGNIDKLTLYSLLLMIIALLVYALYYLYCRCKIKTVKFNLLFDRERFRSLIGFASWSALGEMSWAATLQGVNVVLNIFFSPVVNAARGISYQVLNAVNRFVQSFQMAVNPQIIKLYATDDIASMKTLVYRSTRFSVYLLLLLILPLLFRTEYIMKLWLGDVPEHLVLFCRLILVNALLDVLSNLHTTVAKAYGKIRNYQIIISLVLFLNLPLSYVCLRGGAPPESTYWVYSFVSILLLIIRLLIIKRMVGFSVVSYIKDVLCPISIVVILCLPLPVYLNKLIPESFIGLLVFTIISTISLIVSLFSFGITASERNFIVNKLKDFYKKCQLSSKVQQ